MAHTDAPPPALFGAGLQAQAAECLIVGEIATSRLVVALNKVDLLPEEVRSALPQAQQNEAYDLVGQGS